MTPPPALPCPALPYWHNLRKLQREFLNPQYCEKSNSMTGT